MLTKLCAGGILITEFWLTTVYFQWQIQICVCVMCEMALTMLDQRHWNQNTSPTGWICVEQNVKGPWYCWSFLCAVFIAYNLGRQSWFPTECTLRCSVGHWSLNTAMNSWWEAFVLCLCLFVWMHWLQFPKVPYRFYQKHCNIWCMPQPLFLIALSCLLFNAFEEDFLWGAFLLKNTHAKTSPLWAKFTALQPVL